MATRKDVQEIMGLSAATGSPNAPPPKRAKVQLHQRPRVSGINREVVALYGERPPPVAVVDVKKTYQAKLNRSFKPAHWETAAFRNPARADDLILRHWRRKPAPKPPEDVDAMEEDAGYKSADSGTKTPPREYEFAKYNLQVEVDSYTDEQYEKHLRDDDWSKEETEYLIEMVKEYHQRWPLIADRWDYTAPEGSPETAKDRSIEAMKQRFYSLRARLMELRTPQTAMTAEEFMLFETLRGFDAAHETTRKELATALFHRTADEIREEQHLLTELQRITMGSDRLAAERADTRAVLDAPAAAPSAPTYQSSAALASLFQQLFQSDRSKKRGGRLSLNTTGDAGPGSAGGHRDSVGTAGPGSAHPSRAGGAQQQQQAAAPSRASLLSPAAEARFGASTHERLSSGVNFRSDRVLKLRQAKSQIQTQKIAGALQELAVPDLITLPTTRVCDTLAALVGRITKAIDARKTLEREEADVTVGEKMREERLAKDTGARGETGMEGAAASGDVEMAEGRSQIAAPETKAEGSTAASPSTAAPAPARPGSSSSTAAATRAARKRSASVLSAASSKSSKSKRSRK